MGNKKIFLVEDQAIIAMDILNILRNEGFSDICLIRNILQFIHSGIYFYTLEVVGINGEKFSSTKKMMFIK